MAAGRGTGLADEQVVQLRGSVAAGGRPRVRVSGAQFPVGTTGMVIRVGEPAADGADFVTVRVKVSGVVDELPFAPAELSMAGRGHAQAAVVEVPRGTAKAPAPRTAHRSIGEVGGTCAC